MKQVRHVGSMHSLEVIEWILILCKFTNRRILQVIEYDIYISTYSFTVALVKQM